MDQAVKNIIDYCDGVDSDASFSSDTKTVDACLRNFQVLGDAAKQIPASIRKDLPDLPWQKITGMRNVLVHEYFGVSPKIIWRTIRKDLPEVRKQLSQITARLSQPSHPWRICPPGESYVRSSKVSAHLREKHLVKEHLRRDCCREHPSSVKDMITHSEATDIAALFFGDLEGSPKNYDLGFSGKGNKFDVLIRGWTRYWNEVFAPTEPLDPNVIKALIASESSFDPNRGRGKRNSARGLMQLMPATIQYLNGQKNELKFHTFEFDSSEALDPNLNIAAGVRWLFRKRDTASARLKRQATWDEAVGEYKDYLRRKVNNTNDPQKGMVIYRQFLRKLEEK